MLIALALLACGIREVPDHLRVDPPAATQETAPAPATPEEAIARLVGRDPLLRRPALPPAGWLQDLDAPALAAWDAVARTDPQEAGSLVLLEAQHPGTVAVPLARGWRLGSVEGLTTELLEAQPTAERAALLWLSPLGPAPTLNASRRPWAWLTATTPAHQELLRYGEALVLRGWLDGPGIPTGAVVEVMASGPYDRLTGSVEGRLLLARREPSEAEAIDLSDLKLLVALLLERAAADRDGEQEAHRARCAEVAEARGLLEGERDPLPAFAEATLEALIASAAHDRATGGALLAWSIRRWLGGCEACAGLDRSPSLDAALRWAPELEPWVAATRVAFLKDAVDRFEVGLEHDRTTGARAPLADALMGLGHEPPPITWVERTHADAGTWLTLTRMTGSSDGATQEEGLAALHAALARSAEALGDLEELPEDLRKQAARVARRATP